MKDISPLGGKYVFLGVTVGKRFFIVRSNDTDPIGNNWKLYISFIFLSELQFKKTSYSLNYLSTKALTVSLSSSLNSSRSSKLIAPLLIREIML